MQVARGFPSTGVMGVARGTIGLVRTGVVISDFISPDVREAPLD